MTTSIAAQTTKQRREIAKYLQAAEAGAEEERIVTMEEAASLGGFLSRIAPSMLRLYGVYGYKDATGRKILLRLNDPR